MPDSGFTPDPDDTANERHTAAAAALTAADPRRPGQADDELNDGDLELLRARAEGEDRHVRLQEPVFEDDELDADYGPDEPDAEPKMTAEEAVDVLDLMLSHDAPPPLPEEFDMPQLLRRLNADRKRTGQEQLANFRVRVRSLDDRELTSIGRQSERRPTREQRDRGLTTGGRDMDRFHRLVVASALVQPDLGDKRILSKYKTPERAVMAWFLPGEILRLSEYITELSGFGDDAVVRAGK